MPRLPALARALRILVVLAFVATCAGADEVLLKNGRVLEGVVVEESASQVVIEVAAGKMTLPRSMVETVEITTSRVSEYQRRADALAADDVEGWLRLAFWARDHRLDTKGRLALDRVLAIDPAHLVTRELLGLLGREDPAEPYAVAPERWTSDGGALEAPWTAPALVPQDGPGRHAAEQALALAGDCRWAEAGWRLRELRRERPDEVDDTVVAAMLLALDLAAHASSPDIESYFSAEEAHFERSTGALSLRFERAQPPPWEIDGRAGGTESFILGQENRLALRIPFRRPGQNRHLDTVDKVEEVIRFEGRWRGAAEGATAGVAIHWQTDEATPSTASLRVESDADGRTRGEVNSHWSDDSASYRQPRDLPRGFLASPRFLRAKVENGPASFSIEDGFTESLNLPRSDHLLLEIEGLHGPSELEGFSVSGAVDGLWLARQIALAEQP